MEALTGLSAGIEMRKKKQSSENKFDYFLGNDYFIIK